MPIGVIVNCLAVAFGGMVGSKMGQKMNPVLIEKLNSIMGLCSIGMGIVSVILMKQMPAVILAIVVGSLIGLLLHVGDFVNRRAIQMEQLMTKWNVATSSSLSKEAFRSTLITTIVLFCASGTGIYGCLDAGMSGDSSILISKSILDLFTAAIFACQLGMITSLVAVPQFIIFTLLVLCSQFILPFVDATMLADFKACGGFLIIATGFRILKLVDFPIADMTVAMVLVFPLSALWESVIIPLLR